MFLLWGRIEVMFFDSTLDSLLSFFSHDMAIDLGSANLRIFVKNKGIAVNEPMVAVFNKKTGAIIATGIDAKQMIGRVPSQVELIRPVQGGVISDFDAVVYIIKKHIENLHRSYGLIPKIPKPRVLIGVNSEISEVEKKALIDAVSLAGARRVIPVLKLQAAIIGSGLSFSSKKGVLIVDFGHATTEIGLATGAGIIASKLLKVGGATLNESISNFIRLKYGLLIGEESSEEIKINVGVLLSTKEKPHEKFAVIRGRDMESGLPRSLRISSIEINETLMTPVNFILENIKEIIEKSPPEILGDLADLGLILVGGQSLIPGLADVISDIIKTQAWVIKDPGTVVIRGMSQALIERKSLKKIRI